MDRAALGDGAASTRSVQEQIKKISTAGQSGKDLCVSCCGSSPAGHTISDIKGKDDKESLKLLTF